MTCALMICTSLFAAKPKKEVKHTQMPTLHGLDEVVFIQPLVDSELKDISGSFIVDVGCGSTPWTIKAAERGATVCALDSEHALINQAQIAVRQAGVESQYAFNLGSLEKLPYNSSTFDRAICVQSARTLPTGTRTQTAHRSNGQGLGELLKEVARVLKAEGRALIVAPASYGVVFTDGHADEGRVYGSIEQALGKIGKSEDPAVIAHALGNIEGVMRATFVRRGDHYQLVTSEKDLTIGEKIWCKTPTGVSTLVYHSEEEYLSALRQAGLFCVEVKRPCFFGNVKYRMWLEGHQGESTLLGQEYVDHNPFTLFYVVKKG